MIDFLLFSGPWQCDWCRGNKVRKWKKNITEANKDLKKDICYSFQLEKNFADKLWLLFETYF